MTLLNILRQKKQKIISYLKRSFGKHLHLNHLRRLNANSPFRTTPIFIINLQRDVEKRLFITKQLNALGITNYTFFNAIDAKTELFSKIKEAVNYSEELAIKFEGHELSDAIIALAATHLEVYREIKERNLRCAIILEDDAIFIQKHITEFDIENLPADYDICLFEGWLRKKPPEGMLSQGFYDLTSYKGGTAGYLVSQAGAVKLLSASCPLIHPPDGNLTWYNIHSLAGDFGRSVEKFPPLKVYLSFPFPLINGSLAGYWKSSCDSHWVDY
jgi:glycosyl transferase family 25